jgi:hypothetical protein
MIDLGGSRVNAGFHAPSTEKPVLVALKLRDFGWNPYKVFFDPHAGAWVALVIDKTDVNDRSGASRTA